MVMDRMVMSAWKDETTEVEKPRSAEAFALERVAAAAREVQAASTVLQAHFALDGGRQPSMLELARFAAATQELIDAREAFDLLIVGGVNR
jgi:hypothetical protein